MPPKEQPEKTHAGEHGWFMVVQCACFNANLQELVEGDHCMVLRGDVEPTECGRCVEFPCLFQGFRYLGNLKLHFPIFG